MIHIIKEYIAYLKDNPEGHWFKAKLYGWGWAPATWQGWLVLLVFVALTVANAFRLDMGEHSAPDTVTNFIFETWGLVFVLIFICWKKGEKPRWQWGPPKK